MRTTSCIDHRIETKKENATEARGAQRLWHLCPDNARRGGGSAQEGLDGTTTAQLAYELTLGSIGTSLDCYLPRISSATYAPEPMARPTEEPSLV